MKKKITPEQIKNGKVNYSLVDFLRDLEEETKPRVSKADFNHISDKKKRKAKYTEATEEVFLFVYNICYQAALKSPYLKSILDKTNGKDKEIIEGVIKSNKENIERLRAIFLKEIAEGCRTGLTRRQAAKEVITRSKSILKNWRI